MANGALDMFGAVLMRRVRDVAIREVDRAIRGDQRSSGGRRIQVLLKHSNSDSRELLMQFVPMVVDITLHYVLWMFEDERALKVSLDTASGNVPSLRDISDGLSGELYSPKGWIARFSQERQDRDGM